MNSQPKSQMAQPMIEMTNVKYQKLTSMGNIKTSWIPILKRIFSYSWKYKKLIIFGNVSLIFTSVFNIVLPLYIGKVADVINGSLVSTMLSDLMLSISLIFLGMILFGIVKEYFYDLLNIHVVRDMKRELFKSLIEKDIEFYDTRKTGDLLSRLNNDISTIQNSSIVDVSNFIRKVIELIGSIVMMLYISSGLTLMAFICIPITFILLFISAKFKRHKSKEISDANSEANSIASEAFQNVRVVKSFSTENFELENYERVLDKIFDLENNALTVTSFVFFLRACVALGAVLLT